MSYVDTICWRMTEFHCQLRFDVNNGHHSKQQISNLKTWWHSLTYREKVKHSFIWFTRLLFNDMRPELEAYYELLLKNAYFFAPAVGGGDSEILKKLVPKLITPSEHLLQQVIGRDVGVADNYFSNHEVSRYWGISFPRSASAGNFCKIDLPEFGTVDVAGAIYNGLEEATWIVFRRTKVEDNYLRYGLFGDSDCKNAQDAVLTESFARVNKIVKHIIIKYDQDRVSGVKEVVILPPADSDKAKTWKISHDSRSLFKPTSLKGYIRVGATGRSIEKDENREHSQIHFSHRVAVKGHYRNLSNSESRGKNEFTGERTEAGKTWVISHERGGKEYPLVKKTENVYLS